MIPSYEYGASLIQEQYGRTRQYSLDLCKPLEIEDYGVQAMPDVSPPKWHLAHTTWFFETFVLRPYQRNYEAFHPLFHQLFNSYYETLGPAHPRPARGILSRPDVPTVLRYRQVVDQEVQLLLADGAHPERAEILARVRLGIEHEMQHQELLLMDVLYNFSRNPLLPTYNPDWIMNAPKSAGMDWLSCPPGLYEVGATSGDFCFDNELPRHRVYVTGVALAECLTSNAEYLEFMEDGGYEKVDLWLSEGWAFIRSQGIVSPLYWQRRGADWYEFTLSGLRKLDLQRPVSHISYFEADAFARWKGYRLPTEFEWEVLASGLESKRSDWFYRLWQWTSSSYQPYPAFRPARGSLGEYNGKFMCNQYVLRGGAFATPSGHLRTSYRNFFPASSRWMFSGLRLAKEQET